MKPKSAYLAALCAVLSFAAGCALAFFRVFVSRAYTDAAAFHTISSGSVWGHVPNGAALRALLYVLPAAAAALLLVPAFLACRAGVMPGFRPIRSTVGKTAAVTAAVLFFAATAVKIAFGQASASLLTWVSAAFCVAAGVAVIAQLRARDQQEAGLCLVFPLVHCGYYLLLFYRAMAHHAQSLVYDYEILAAVTLMLALYYVCAAHFKKARPAALLWLASLSLMLVTACAVSRLYTPALFGKAVALGAYDALVALATLLLVWHGVFAACRPLPEPAEEPQSEEAPAEEPPAAQDSEE